MKIGPIVLKLRLSNTYFANRVGGAAELDLATTYTLKQDMAFVIPLMEDSTENVSDPSIQQEITERFAVVVAVANDTDPKDLTGIVAYDRLHDIRSELFHALIGWQMGYGGSVSYRGGRLLAIDPSRLWYQFEFDSPALLKTDSDGYGELQYANVDERKPFEDLDDFYKIFNEYILTPSVKWEDLLEELGTEGLHLPLAATSPDMQQMIDMTQQYIGGFEKGFSTGFDFYRINI